MKPENNWLSVYVPFDALLAPANQSPYTMRILAVCFGKENTEAAEAIRKEIESQWEACELKKVYRMHKNFGSTAYKLRLQFMSDKAGMKNLITKSAGYHAKQWMEDIVFVFSAGQRTFPSFEKHFDSHLEIIMNEHVCFDAEKSEKGVYATRHLDLDELLKEAAESIKVPFVDTVQSRIDLLEAVDSPFKGIPDRMNTHMNTLEDILHMSRLALTLRPLSRIVGYLHCPEHRKLTKNQIRIGLMLCDEAVAAPYTKMMNKSGQSGRVCRFPQFGRFARLWLKGYHDTYLHWAKKAVDKHETTRVLAVSYFGIFLQRLANLKWLQFRANGDPWYMTVLYQLSYVVCGNFVDVYVYIEYELK